MTYNTVSWYTYVNDFLSHCRSHTVSLTHIISLSVLRTSMMHRLDIRLSRTYNTASWYMCVNDFLSHCLSHIYHLRISKDASQCIIDKRKTTYQDMRMCHTGWQRCIACLNLHFFSRKRATHYRALLRKTIYKDKASHGSSPLCYPCKNRSCPTQECVIFPRWMSHVPLFLFSSHRHGDHIYMNPVPYINESCPFV